MIHAGLFPAFTKSIFANVSNQNNVIAYLPEGTTDEDIKTIFDMQYDQMQEYILNNALALQLITMQADTDGKVNTLKLIEPGTISKAKVLDTYSTNPTVLVGTETKTLPDVCLYPLKSVMWNVRTDYTSNLNVSEYTIAELNSYITDSIDMRSGYSAFGTTLSEEYVGTTSNPRTVLVSYYRSDWSPMAGADRTLHEFEFKDSVELDTCIFKFNSTVSTYVPLWNQLYLNVYYYDETLSTWVKCFSETLKDYALRGVEFTPVEAKRWRFAVTGTLKADSNLTTTLALDTMYFGKKNKPVAKKSYNVSKAILVPYTTMTASYKHFFLLEDSQPAIMLNVQPFVQGQVKDPSKDIQLNAGITSGSSFSFNTVTIVLDGTI